MVEFRQWILVGLIIDMDLARMNAFIRKVLDPAQPRSWSIVRSPAGE